jgi:putative flavoprotein involved in K+ transport
MTSAIKTDGGARPREREGEREGERDPLLRVKLADLAAAGVERRFERTAGVRDGRPVLEDGTVLEVANVIWCTGFRPEYGWIRQPVTSEDGWPAERTGVALGAAGLYFVGIPFQRAFTSMLVGGAGRDAAIVVGELARRAGWSRGQRGAAGDQAGALEGART